MQYYTAGYANTEMYGEEAQAFSIIRPTPSAVERWLAEYSSRPWQYRARPATWRERERGHFYSRDYVSPPWSSERFWQHNDEIHADHFAHVSLEDPTMIAFTETPEKGEADRQMRMKPGRYLQRYFSDILTTKQIAFYAEWFVRGDRPTDMDDGATIGFASTEEEILEAYSQGPYSCMRGDDYPRVYAAGDLAIAYLGPIDNVDARALCWPDKKVFGRVYPDKGLTNEPGHKLFWTLRNQGWKHISEDDRIFDGARLQKIHIDRDRYVMPYLDNGYMFSDSDCGRYFVMMQYGDYDGPDEHGVVSLSGDTEPEYDYHCDACSEGLNDGDEYTVYCRWTPQGEAEEPYIYCSSCLSCHTFYCEATEEYYRDRTADSVEVRTLHFTETWNLTYAEHAGNAFYCDATDQYYDASDYDSVGLANGEIWLSSYFDNYGFRCSYDGDNYSREEESKIFPGFPASLDEVDLPASVRLLHLRPEGEHCDVHTQLLSLAA